MKKWVNGLAICVAIAACFGTGVTGQTDGNLGEEVVSTTTSTTEPEPINSSTATETTAQTESTAESTSSTSESETGETSTETSMSNSETTSTSTTTSQTTAHETTTSKSGARKYFVKIKTKASFHLKTNSVKSVSGKFIYAMKQKTTLQAA